VSASEPPSQPPSPPPPPGGPSGPPPGAGQPQGWSQPAYGAPGYQPAPQTDGLAIAALCCAIASFVVCPVIPAIVALVLAHNSRQKIDASGGRLTGEGFNTAARIIAWVHIGLAVLAIVILVIVGLAGGFDDDDDFDDEFGKLGVLVESIRYVAVRLGF
jgi:hypothetical protein